MDARERLLAEATRQFVERGFDGTSMQQIADACGVTKAALYHHYAGKADLLLDIVGGYLDQVADVVDRAGAASGAGEQVHAVVRGLFDLPVGSRAVMRLAMHDLRHLPEDRGAAFNAAYAGRFLRPLIGMVAAGMESGEFIRRDPGTVVWLLLGMLYPFFSGRRSDDEDAVVDDLLEVLLHGLSA
ncbi:MAG TPA: TetR/AcrR family transcriptional regulator [Propionibacterium sp.]|nr:TetR/AcrR family transcriptional regulator [Propionibacterium sp.]